MTSFDLLVTSIACGIGLIVAGLGILALRSTTGKVATCLTGAIAVISGSYMVAPHAANTVATIAAVLLAFPVSIWLWRTETLTRLRFALTKPVVAGIVLALGGAGLIAAGSWRYDYVEFTSYEKELELLEHLAQWHPPLEAAPIDCRADSGVPVPVFVATEKRLTPKLLEEERTMLAGYQWESRIIHRRHADDTSNCHGWVFTGGKYWVLGRDVPAILSGNGYKTVTEPKSDDIAIYKNAEGVITHTAIVRSVGSMVLVESKWGWMGVYLHDAIDSCYGTNITYYRAPRHGHLFAALKPNDANPIPQATPPRAERTGVPSQ